MKKSIICIVALICLIFNLSAQKISTLNVTLKNNSFTHADLVNAYGQKAVKYASANIVNDKFTMQTNIEEDIYRLDFGNGAALLVVIAPGETINLTLDAENPQEIISVTGSESMKKVKKMSYYSLHKKIVIDSINNALQEDQDKKYWSDFSQKINLFRQTNDDVDGYVKNAFQNADSLVAVFNTYMKNGKIAGNQVNNCAEQVNKWLKKTEINYAPFDSYTQNVSQYYTFSRKKVANSEDFYAKFDTYISHLEERHEVAKSAFENLIPKINKLMHVRDSLAYNNLLSKKNQNEWLNNVYSTIYKDIATAASKKESYLKNIKQDEQIADQLVIQSQEKLRQVVAKYQNAYDETDNYLTNRLRDEIRANKDDLCVLMYLDMFPQDKHGSLHTEVITALHEKHPNHPIVSERWNYMNSPASKVVIGAIAPDLAFPNPEGKILRLSDLKGKVVLIDFWASWCGPCRRENPNVTRIYNLYHDKGFEIFSVSLDSDAESWKRAIAADKLIWPNHVSDLKKWQSAAAAIYGVRSIPATFLLDKEGRIVQKNLRGADLERAVKQLLE